MRKLLAAVGITAAIATGSVAVATIVPAGIAGAQDAASSVTRRGEGHPRLKEAARQVITTAADAMGMEARDLARELWNGKSLRQVAEEQGVDPAVVSAALVDAVNARIDQAVAEDKIDETRAEEIKAKVPDRIEQLMDRTRQPR